MTTEVSSDIAGRPVRRQWKAGNGTWEWRKEEEVGFGVHFDVGTKACCWIGRGARERSEGCLEIAGLSPSPNCL